MKQYLYLLAFIALFTACVKHHDEMAMPLAITGFLPSSGNAGTVITIHGTGFSRDLAGNTVSFNGMDARIMDASDTTLIVQAPDKGATGPVAVTTNGHTTQGSIYTYQALSIHGISPANGPAGTNVYITGAGFTSPDGPAEVTVNGHPAIVSNSNDTLLVATVPVDAGSGPIEVTVNGEHAAGPAFNFQSIAKIKPSKGGEGTTVTITGTGFSTIIDTNVVAFNGVPATVIKASAGELVVVAPKGVKSGPVSLTINGQKTAGPVFTVVAPPSLQSVSPLSGPVGTTMTINGDNFSEVRDEDSVTINGMYIPVTNATAKQLVLMLPQGITSGVLKVVVNGQSVTGPVFTVQSLGVSKLLPDNGLEGSVITVKGTGFSPTPANNQVSVNGLAVTVTAASDSELTVILPAGITTGTLNVTTGSLSAVGPVLRRAGVITFYKGDIATGNPTGMVIDSKGNVFVGKGSQVFKITPDGVAHDFAGSTTTGNVNGTGADARFFYINGMTIDAQDNIFIADAFNYNVRKLTPDGTATTIFSGTPQPPRYIARDPQGNTYLGSDYNGVYVIPAGGTLIKPLTQGGINCQFAVYNGSVFISSPDQQVINQYSATAGNYIKQFVGVFFQNGYVDGPVGTNKLYGPAGQIYDPVSRLVYFIDAYNYSIRAYSPDDGSVTTISGAGGTYQAFKNGYVDGTLMQALFSVSATSPITVDKQGNIYVLEQNNGTIRKILLK